MSRGLPLLLVVVLVACATPLPEGSLDQRAAALQALEDWTLDGRLAVSDGRQSWQAGVRWQQQSERYAIDLIGPLGQGRLDIRGDATGVVLRDGEHLLYANDPDTLLEQASGIPVPIEGLRYWVLGLPAPDSAARPVVDDNGLLRRLLQDDWQIVYDNYVTIDGGTVDGLALPQRIRANRDTLDIRLLITRWTLPDGS